MTREQMPHVEVGDLVKLVALNGNSIFGSFQRFYDQSKGDTLISVLRQGAVQSFGLKTLRQVEVL